MSVFALGLNHTTAPVDLRGRFAFSPEQIAPTLRAFRERLQKSGEVAIVSTCNRTEVVVQEVYLNRRIEKQVTEETIRKRYDAFVKANPAKEEVNARHILVQTETQAKEIVADLGKGADFAELARAKSIDPAGKQQGGDLGYFSREEMVPEFSEAAFKLKDGATSAPVRTQFGWHVIRVEARRTSSQPLEEVREKLINDMSQEIMSGVVTALRKDAKIEVFNLDGTPAAPQPG